jgi:hypothetical protein
MDGELRAAMDHLELSRHYLRMVSSRTRKTGWWSLLLALVVVMGAGCAQLLGLEELREKVDGGAPADASEQAPDAAIVDCATSDQCIVEVPICDLELGTCRGCKLDQECAERDPQNPICAPNGHCGACAGDPDCTDPDRPICDTDTATCRGCQAHAECASAVCDIGASACVDPAEIVYVSSTTGSFDATCGAQDLPCRSLGDGVDKVTFDRSYLRLTGTFSERLTLSANTFRVIGEGATLDLTPVDFDPGIAGVTVNMGARALIDGLRVTNLSVGGGIDCSQGELTLRQVTVDSNEGSGVNASDCPLNIQESRITGNSERGVNAGTATGVGNLVIERSLIAENYRGGIDSSIAPLLIRNNLILRNSNLGEYQGAIRLRGSGSNSVISYNTFVGNMVNANYIGIIGCSGAVLSSNIIWGNLYPPDSDVDQTIIGCDQVRNNLSDSMLENHPQNYLGDPLFVLATDDDYHLMPGSPALDLGEPGLANLLDYAGNPRPVGAGPDIGALEAPAP